MPFDGSGNYSLPPYPAYPAVSGEVIRADNFNTCLADLAAALSGCVTRGGQSPFTNDQSMGGKKLVSVGKSTARDQYARIAEVQDGEYQYLTTISGTANAITAAAPLSMAAYKAGQVFYLTISAANTGAATLNLNGLGAKAITRPGGGALQAGDLALGSVIPIIYDGTQFQVVNTPAVGADLSAYALKDGSNATGVSWGISITGQAATALVAATANAIADGAVSAATKIANNVITLAKLARVGTSGHILYSGGGASDPYFAALPASVTTFNTRSGPVTLASSDVTAALGFTPISSAPPMTAIVNAERVVAGSSVSVRFTRANGTTFDVDVTSVSGGSG